MEQPAIAGAEQVTEALEIAVNTKCGGTSKDGKFTLEKSRLLGLAPVIMNGKFMDG